MRHEKSNSNPDISLTASSSPTSCKPPVYFVTSPSSRDSHDDKSTSSRNSTPIYGSPMESPSHHSSSYGRHSRSSSSSRMSGNWRWARGYRRRSAKGWQECNVIQEEVDYNDFDDDQELTTRCKFFLVILVLAAIFAVFCLIIWGVGKPYKAQITMKSLTVHDFYFGQGSDHTGVPTKLITINCSVNIDIYNPATFFGIDVRSDPFSLIYLKLTVATGQLKKYYQRRKSGKIVSVNLEGVKVPMYGAGATLNSKDVKGRVPMRLDFVLHTRGFLVGKLVKTKHITHISCSLIINFSSTKEINFEPDSCKYYDITKG